MPGTGAAALFAERFDMPDAGRSGRVRPEIDTTTAVKGDFSAYRWVWTSISGVIARRRTRVHRWGTDLALSIGEC
ncbi:hypothetical protein [Mycobacterium sp. 1274756.6]|uniref:hypothetical protein n=1 Tax=Mycobacterium sp. 1274756.6 TaxID=1834076 RepID=UPI0007FDB9E2|nr:hypothetical protein [Mycobacterium sp. 1274756.6]OBJ73107.1 hypothetical protein A5643_04465 [Mycobacterium sp. 1274756.6]